MSKLLPRTKKPATGQRAEVRASVYQVSRADTNTSRQIEAVDAFESYIGNTAGATVLPTPYNVSRLFDLREQSNMLRQCIEAMVINIVLTGWEVDTTIRGEDPAADEAHILQSFIDNANTEESLSSVMEKVIWDRETCGFGFIEVIRDAMQEIALLRHASALSTRLTSKHEKEVLVTNTILRGRRVATIKEFRKFRKFVQIHGARQVWFKEFGDPRKMDSRTGLFEGEQGYQRGSDATELVHLRLPSNDAYGAPRWINQLPSILGSREAEEVNMRYFQDNTVPPMLLLVGNGRLTQASHRELVRTLNSEGIGADRQNKIMLLEAVGEGDSLDGKQSSIDLKVEKLTDTRQSDGLFKSYDEGNMSKVRSSFRLPPVIVGMSQDVNFATATTSVFVAESQVFAPERSKNDEILNKLLINGPNGMRLKSAKLTSRTPSITSPEMVVKTLTAGNVMGAVTPRSAQKVMNKMLQLELPEYPEKGEAGYEEWMDQPMVMGVQAQKTHAAQNLKSDENKDVEDTGDVSASQPKHGEE